jgi:hypothetical protein
VTLATCLNVAQPPQRAGIDAIDLAALALGRGNTNCLMTVRRAQVRRPVNARGLGRWHAYASELAPLIDELESAGSLDAWRENQIPEGRVL